MRNNAKKNRVQIQCKEHGFDAKGHEKPLMDFNQESYIIKRVFLKETVLLDGLEVGKPAFR